MPMKLCICGHHQNDGLHYRSDGIGSSSCDTDGSARHLLVPFIRLLAHDRIRMVETHQQLQTIDLLSLLFELFLLLTDAFLLALRREVFFMLGNSFLERRT